MEPSATLRYCTHKRTGVTAWHVGIDDAEGDHHELVVDNLVSELPSLIARFCLGKGSVAIREDQPAADIELVLAACGKTCSSLARYAVPRFAVSETVEV